MMYITSARKSERNLIILAILTTLFIFSAPLSISAQEKTCEELQAEINQILREASILQSSGVSYDEVEPLLLEAKALVDVYNEQCAPPSGPSVPPLPYESQITVFNEKGGATFYNESTRIVTVHLVTTSDAYRGPKPIPEDGDVINVTLEDLDGHTYNVGSFIFGSQEKFIFILPPNYPLWDDNFYVFTLHARIMGTDLEHVIREGAFIGSTTSPGLPVFHPVTPPMPVLPVVPVNISIPELPTPRSIVHRILTTVETALTVTDSNVTRNIRHR